MIVTIDGPAGSGKSTAARGLSVRLGFEFLDTGAMYRCVAWSVVQQSVDPSAESAVVAVSQQIKITFSDTKVYVDGHDITQAIRTPEITEIASLVAQYPAVRSELVRLQRQAAEGKHIVSEGRDQGTVVFPEAFCKFFLVADSRERARRRHTELKAQGKEISVSDILQQMDERDQRDVQRVVSPLIPADDAIEVNTSRLTIDEVLDQLEATVRSRMRSES